MAEPTFPKKESESKVKRNKIIPVDYSLFSKTELEQKRENLLTELNHLIANEYIERLNRNNQVPALGNLSWDLAKEYWSKFPELKADRDEFEKSNESLMNFINQKDSRFKEATEKYYRKEISLEERNAIQLTVYRDLKETYPAEYGKLVDDRKNKLGISSRKTLEYIVADYKNSNKPFPVGWIPEQQLIKSESGTLLKKLRTEIDKVEDELIKRI